MSLALPPSIILVRVSFFLFRLHSDGTFCAFFKDTFFRGLRLFGHTFCTPHLSLFFAFDVCVLEIVRLICVRLHIRIVVGGNRSAQRTSTREHTVITALISMLDVRNHSRALLYYFAYNGKSIFFRFLKKVKRDAPNRLNAPKAKKEKRKRNFASHISEIVVFFRNETNKLWFEWKTKDFIAA